VDGIQVGADFISTDDGQLNKFADWKKAALTYRELPWLKNLNKCDEVYYSGIPAPSSCLTSETFVNAGCPHNQYVAFHQRYLKETPNVGKLFMPLLNRIITSISNKMAKSLDGEITNCQEQFSSMRGPLLSRYVKAAKQVTQNGFNAQRDSKIKTFIKNERYFEFKPPRLILGRDPKFNLLYNRYVEPLEKAYRSLSCVALGRNFLQMGDRLSYMATKCVRFRKNDMSKYESTQRDLALRIEYDINVRAMIKSGFSDAHIDEYTTLFAIKRMKNCVSEGVDVCFEECRGSGDRDTGLGNGQINCVATKYDRAVNCCPHGYDCMLELCDCGNFPEEDLDEILGDDNYSGYLHDFDEGRYINTYRSFGLDSKIEWCLGVHDVTFCSGIFVEYQPSKYIYTQDPVKIIKSLQSVINNEVVERGFLGHYYSSLGYMYEVLYKGLPTLPLLGKYLQTCNKRGVFRFDPKMLKGSYILEQNCKFGGCVSGVYSLSVDRDLALVSMSMACGLEVAELTHLEEYYSQAELVLPIGQFRKRRNQNQKIREDLQNLCVLVDLQHPYNGLTKEHKSKLRDLQNVRHQGKMV